MQREGQVRQKEEAGGDRPHRWLGKECLESLLLPMGKALVEFNCVVPPCGLGPHIGPCGWPAHLGYEFTQLKTT
jgi:hypothetical protein